MYMDGLEQPPVASLLADGIVVLTEYENGL